MSRFSERIGGYRRYVPALVLLVLGVLIMYWPGGLGTDDPHKAFITLGSALAVVPLAWAFLTLDRRVSGNPRYEREAYQDLDDDEDEG